MFDLNVPLAADIALFMLAAVVIGCAGVKAAGLADRLADRTGMGEALTGTVFLGFLTALPGLLASVVAAAKGQAALAISNAIGGIAVQTVALAVADIAYRRANLEHAAASVPNMMQATMLIALMVLVVCGLSGPDVAVAHVHPVTVVLILAAASAFWLVVGTRDEPMWEPTATDETVTDEPDERQQREKLAPLLAGLIVAAGLTGLSGALVAESAENIVEKTGLSEVIVGGLFMALATSLPELVTSIAAVRRGALTLAVSDIVGGNFFDVLFVAGADLAYLSGSIYHAPGVGLREVFLTSFTILLNVVLLAGLIYRQKRGPGNIGFESVLMILLYVGGFLVMSLTM
jgi:cation:H+ antiporter